MKSDKFYYIDTEFSDKNCEIVIYYLLQNSHNADI